MSLTQLRRNEKWDEAASRVAGTICTALLLMVSGLVAGAALLWTLWPADYAYLQLAEALTAGLLVPLVCAFLGALSSYCNWRAWTAWRTYDGLGHAALKYLAISGFAFAAFLALAIYAGIEALLRPFLPPFLAGMIANFISGVAQWPGLSATEGYMIATGIFACTAAFYAGLAGTERVMQQRAEKTWVQGEMVSAAQE